jgi:hypothetical protein
MDIKIGCYGWDRDLDYYPNRMFIFTIPYFLLNLLDLLITRIALATSENLYELNPFYYHLYFQPVKIFVPILLLALYLSLYCLNKTEYGRKAVGDAGLYCIITLTVLSMIVCINNVFQLAFVV